MSKKKNISFTFNESEIEREERKKARREAFLDLNLSTRVIEDKRKKDPKYKKVDEE